MLEQDSVDKSIPKNQEELGVKELHSAGDAEIPQDVRTPLQSDNLFPRESAGNDLISSGLVSEYHLGFILLVWYVHWDLRLDFLYKKSSALMQDVAENNPQSNSLPEKSV